MLTAAPRSLSDARLAATPRSRHPVPAIRLSQFRFESSFESKPENAKTEAEPADKSESKNVSKSKLENTESESEPVRESKSKDPFKSKSASAGDPFLSSEGTSEANPNSENGSVAGTESEGSFEAKFASAVHTYTPDKATRKAKRKSGFKSLKTKPEEALDSWAARFAYAANSHASGKAASKASFKPEPKAEGEPTVETGPDPVLSPESEISFEAALESAFDPSAFDGAAPNVESDIEPEPAFDGSAFDQSAFDGSVFTVEPRSTLIPESEHTSQSEAAKPFQRIVNTYTGGKRSRRQNKDVPTYLFSNLVLDLGAEGAAGVREYDEADEKGLTEKWNVPDDADVDSRKRLLRLAQDANNAKRRYETLERTPDKRHWRIRESDILSIALRGVGPSTVDAASSTERSRLPKRRTRVPGPPRRFLDENGIPKPIFHDDPTLLWWMAARNTDDKPAELTTAAPVHYTEPLKQDQYEGFRRHLSAAVASRNGIEGSMVFQASIYKNWLQGPNRPAELRSSYGILLFLGELDTAFRMTRTNMSFHLCRVALDHASRGLYIDPAAHFLTMLTRWASDGQGYANSFASAVQETIQDLTLSLDTGAPGAELLPRSEVLSLLTGFGTAGRAFPLAFGDVMVHKRARGTSYAAYIELLARLGALRTLWLEWGRITVLEKDNGPGDPGLPKAEIFMQALVVAREVVREYNLQDVRVPERIEAAVLEDCESMPKHLKLMGRSADVDIPPRLPFQLIEAFEMDSMTEAVARIQQLISELD